MLLKEGKYYGKVLSSVDLDGLILSKSLYADSTVLPLHYHKNPYFCYVLSGHYSEHTSKSDLTCTKGDVIFHPGSTEHYNNFSDHSAVCFNLEFSECWISRFAESKISQSNISKANNYNIQIPLLKIYKELNNFDDHSSLMIEGLMLEAIAGFSRSYSSENAVPFYLKKIIEYLNDEFSSTPTLLQLSKIADVSPEHLAREFKSKMKLTIGEYMKKLKVNRCTYLLRHTKKSMSDIAFEAGFSDQSHFCRVFKEHTGLTPLQFRSSD